MEQLLHYCWKHRLLPPTGLTTTDGRAVEVVDPGLYNRRHAGPDFFNAKVKIDGTLWVGNVEIHQRASDWQAHGHQTDPRYDNVVLHVCGQADTTVLTASGHQPPQVEVQVPQHVVDHYEELLREDRYPPCHRLIPELPRLTLHAWLSALQTERLEQKTEQIRQRVERCNGSWEDGYFVTLARNFGFGVNGDAFEAWALTLPLQAAVHHRDDPFQVEAIFMGQAGLLDVEAAAERHREAMMADDYFNRLRNEYQYLAHKFSLQHMDAAQWRFLRLRPQNFPHIRLSQLTMLYHGRRAGLSQLIECTTVDELRKLFQTTTTPYWETHYAFGRATRQSTRRLSDASVNLLIVNTAIPMLFAYGRHHMKEALCDRAFDLLEQMKAEDNHITRMWQQCGLTVSTAGGSQALIQLKSQYCDRRDCLRCRIGFEYLKKR